jgi:hypothetical protein
MNPSAPAINNREIEQKEMRMREIMKKESLTGLQELLQYGSVASRPVERGFYIGHGTRGLIPLVLDALVAKMCDNHPRGTGRDPRRQSAVIDRLFWIDSGNVFDSYRVAAAARQRGLDPLPFLRAIRVARPFTAFQFHEMLTRIPIDSPNPPLVIISDLTGLFYDSEITDPDVERAFRRFMERLGELKRRAIVLGLLLDNVAPPTRQHFLPALLAQARHVIAPTRIAQEPNPLVTQMKALFLEARKWSRVPARFWKLNSPLGRVELPRPDVWVPGV